MKTTQEFSTTTNVIKSISINFHINTLTILGIIWKSSLLEGESSCQINHFGVYTNSFPALSKRKQSNIFWLFFGSYTYRYKIGCIRIPSKPGFNSIFIHYPACLPGRRGLIIESDNYEPAKINRTIDKTSNDCNKILLTGYTLKKHTANSIQVTLLLSFYFLSFFFNRFTYI